MEDYAGRILSDRYRLPLPPSDEYEPVETRAFDTRSGQEVLVRQVPLPEIVDAELLDGTRGPATGRRSSGELPAVRRAIAAAQAAASVPDHARLDQVFDVFAEGGSLWIVSELVPARPLAALIAEEPLTPYRAAEVAADVLTALRVLHAHGWTHRNITVRTVLICDDGRVVLTGLAAGAAEEALCGYDPVPEGAGIGTELSASEPVDRYPASQGPAPDPSGRETARRGFDFGPRATDPYGRIPGPGRPPAAPEPASEAGSEPRTLPPVRESAGIEYAPLVAPGYDTGPRYSDHITPERPPIPVLPVLQAGPAADSDPSAERPDTKAAARAGTIAAYRAGARAAAAKVEEERRAGTGAAPEPRPEGSNLPQGYSYPYGGPAAAPAAPWHGATPRRRPDQDTAAEREPTPEPEPACPPTPEPEPAYPPDPEPEHAPGAAHTAESPGAVNMPALPARLALPQGYRQAEPPDPTGPFPVVRPDEPRPGTGVAVPRPAPPRPIPRTVPEPVPPAAPRPVGVDGWSGARIGGGGPRTGLDAERARQTRMAVVGAVTERWAPEQAGPVHGHWQLAAPVGPATDLWALGALLYRAVQGHAPYPEESVPDLVEMVCSEPPAFAEECGPLRPIVESLLRQDPTERPDFEELRGWLRSLVRSAPEPDGAFGMLPMADPDPTRLPVVRRRGDVHGRHRSAEAPRRKPRSLGRTLLVGVLALLAAAVGYALLFMPRSADQRAQGEPDVSTPRPPVSSAPPTSGQGPGRTPSGTPESKPASQSKAPVPAPPGYTAQQDPEHFEMAVPDGWERRGINEAGQVRYVDGQFVLTVVPGRDKVEGGRPDPLTYQKDKEPELSPYRNSSWASGGDVKSTTVGQQVRVTGRYTWIDSAGRSVVARNFVVALGGVYHVVLVTGPQDEEGRVTEVFEKATGSYKPGG
ncbi:serine/threonine protein kinase [Streptomyces sp. NPDC060010]|uniref:serine/threonine protein kinase n=1 Tax=Streptomyces sp. NPDC060010 TaxID=3347036 RepID=UPI0036A86E76